MKLLRLLLLLLAPMLLIGCSTITSYSPDIASESPVYGTMTKDEAVDIVKKKGRVSGDVADYRSFLTDENGFSYIKTTEKTETKWKKGKPVGETKKTNTLTHNVPWNAVTDIDPYLQQYDFLLGDAYRMRLRFNMAEGRYGQRSRTTENFDMSCKTYEDLVDLTAAIRLLTGE